MLRLIDQWSVSCVGVKRLVQLSLTHEDIFSHLGEELQEQEGAHSQCHQKGEGGHQGPQGGCLLCGPYSGQGIALVVMDKSQYVNKCMALLDDTKV